MLPLIVVVGLLLLVLAYDISSCLSFYRDIKSGAGSVATGVERPRRLAPDQVSLGHALLFLLQKANYWWQLITSGPLLAWLYLRPRATTDEDVARLMVNTSLVTWITARPMGPGAVHATLRVEKFAFPLIVERYDNELLVEFELHQGEPAPEGGGTTSLEPALKARTLRFELNGMAIDSLDEQLSILAMMISSVTHPVIHSFNNKVYASHNDGRLREFSDFFLHGQYLNWCAWFFPGLLFRIAPRGHHWYKKVLTYNAELPLCRHSHASLAILAPFSRSTRFLLAARSELARVLKRYEVPVDREALYICTIMHSIDHVSCDAYSKGHLLRNEKLPNRGFFNFIALMFYRPAQHFWTNLLKDKHRKTPLYAELYAGLRAIDPGLADQVTLSISY